ncbi:MAG: aromatic-ring-hydroxylating dioxygenase subunit beta [Lautropia sp.]
MRPNPDISMTMRLAVFMSDYARCLDEGELERWPGFFTDDCVYKVTSRENVAAGYQIGLIYADSKGMLNDRVKSLREVNIYEEQTYRHILGLPHVAKIDPDGSLHARTGFIVARIMHTGETSIFATGSYHDKIALGDDHVALRERIVVCDSSHIDTLLAIPL